MSLEEIHPFAQAQAASYIDDLHDIIFESPKGFYKGKTVRLLDEDSYTPVLTRRILDRFGVAQLEIQESKHTFDSYILGLSLSVVRLHPLEPIGKATTFL